MDGLPSRLRRWRIGVTAAGAVMAAALAVQAQTRPEPFSPVAAPTQASPPRDRTAVASRMSSIEGRVTAADSGTPLRRAQIIARSETAQDVFSATTDENGRYTIPELPAGRYRLSASKGGYVSLQYGQRRVLEQGTVIELTDVQTITDVDFLLPRGSAIAGRVFDEFGEPVADALVSALTYRYLQGRRELTPVATSSFRVTDDLGQFRLFGLPPGRYVLQATVRALSAIGAQAVDTSGYAATYYPGTPNVGEAQAVAVDVGQELTGIDLVVPLIRTSRISGTVVDSRGRPLGGRFLTVRQRTGAGAVFFVGAGGMVQPDGTFTIGGLAPGDYTLLVLEPLGGANTEIVQADVSVAGTDLDGVRLVGTPGATARGQIVSEGSEPPFAPALLRVMTRQVDSVQMFAPPGRVEDDWTFELPGLVGDPRMSVLGLPPGWALKAVRLGGADLTDRPLAVRGTEPIDGLEVVITDRITRVSGTVTDERGAALADYTVVIFPEDREQRTYPSRFVRATRPNQDGVFEIEGLPPARYLIVAADYVQEGADTDPAFLEELTPATTRVTLVEGERRTLALRRSAVSGVR